MDPELLYKKPIDTTAPVLVPLTNGQFFLFSLENPPERLYVMVFTSEQKLAEYLVQAERECQAIYNVTELRGIGAVIPKKIDGYDVLLAIDPYFAEGTKKMGFTRLTREDEPEATILAMAWEDQIGKA